MTGGCAEASSRRELGERGGDQNEVECSGDGYMNHIYGGDQDETRLDR